MKFLGRDIRLVYVEEFDDPSQMGEWDQFTQTVRVRSGLHPETEKATILHELLHAASDWLGIGLKENQIVQLDYVVRSMLDNDNTL